MRPPWASTIERQIDKPIPIPPCFVVKNVLKIFSILSASIPEPESAKVINTSPLLPISGLHSQHFAARRSIHRFNGIHDQI